MLTTESYYIAWSVYLLAALGLLVVVRGWLLQALSPAPMVTLLLLLAAWMLTPALPQSGGQSYAPAVVVAGFDLLTHGPQAVTRALRPLLWMSGLALTLGAVFYLFQRTRQPGNGKEG